MRWDGGEEWKGGAGNKGSGWRDSLSYTDVCPEAAGRGYNRILTLLPRENVDVDVAAADDVADDDDVEDSDDSCDQTRCWSQ